MDLDHVAFARLVKFDGRAPRRLAPAEIAQIAGRAGRHMSDGTFGTTADLDELDPEMVEAVENHRFDPLTRLYWRKREARFPLADGSCWRASRRGRCRAAWRSRPRPTITWRCARWPACPTSRDWRAIRRSVRLLWEVCQIPDFRKVMSETHARLLAQIYRHLAGPGARLPIDWVAGQVGRLDRADGDIDTLMSRIAHIRTWTYIAQPARTGSPTPRTGRSARAPSRTSCPTRCTTASPSASSIAARRSWCGSSRRPRDLLASVSRDGEVKVEGHPVGRLDGFRFVPDQRRDGERRAHAARRRQPRAARRDRGARARADAAARCRVRARRRRRAAVARRRGRAAAARRERAPSARSRRCRAIFSRAICATLCASASPASSPTQSSAASRVAVPRARRRTCRGRRAASCSSSARRSARCRRATVAQLRAVAHRARSQGAGAARRAARHRDGLFRCAAEAARRRGCAALLWAVRNGAAVPARAARRRRAARSGHRRTAPTRRWAFACSARACCASTRSSGWPRRRARWRGRARSR